MNAARRYGTLTVVALMTLTVLVSPAVAADDGLLGSESIQDDSMQEDDSMTDSSMENDSMQDDSMNDSSMEDDSMENDSMQDDSMEDTESMEDDESMEDNSSADGTETNADGPGFTAALALVALVGAALLAARRSA